jgi:hypothetical protein
MQQRSTRRQTRSRLLLSRAVQVQALERRLLLSAFYDYDVLASTGTATTAGDTISSFKGETSINDDGRVAFVANVTGPNGNGSAIITADGHSTPVKISFPNPSAARSYDFAQIANDNLVVSKDGISGTNLVRTWNALSPASNTIIVRDGDPSPPINVPYDIVQLPTRSNDGNTGFIGLVGSSTSVYTRGPAGNTSLTTVSGGGFRPMIADGAVSVVRTGVSGSQSIVVMSPSYGKILTAAAGDFAAVSQPGISDDGKVVAFAGDSASLGKGIFLSYYDGTKFTDPIRVGGFPNELGTDAAGNGLSLTDFDFSTNTAPSNLSNRVGVVHRDGGVAGIQGDTILLSFIATPSAASRPNPQVAGTPLLFSANRGIWTMTIVPDKPLSSTGTTGTLHFNRRTSPIPVVQVGDTIGGQVVTGFSLFDPIATAARDQDGAVRPTVAPGDHYVVFRATTAAGDRIVRAAQFDTDGDGLYDHWERPTGGPRPSGVDIDGDAVPDLDIASMGANPMHKDVFLEIDWLKRDPVSGISFAPNLTALQDFSDIFANSPLTNPDGMTGVDVHIDAGVRLSQNMGAGSLQGGDTIDKAGNHIHVLYFGATDPLAPFPGNTDKFGRPLVSRAVEDIKKSFFGTSTKDARELVFRYCIFGDYYDVLKDAMGNFAGLGDSSGLSEVGVFDDAVDGTGKLIDERFVPGNDVIVTLQGALGPQNGKLLVPPTGATFVPAPEGFFQSQTLAHEFGHTMGLHHGGFDSNTSSPKGWIGYNMATSKPTYRSLMNYTYQLSPDTAGTLVQDYSRSGDPVFDDWSNVSLGFNQYFDGLGATRSYYSRYGSPTPSEPLEPEPTLTDFAQFNGPIDNTAPTLSITSPADTASIATGGALTVNLTAADDGVLASVVVAFDADGDGTLSASEKVTATSTGPGTYQAVFASVSGPVGQRTLTATASDAVGFETDQSITLSITNGAAVPPKVTASSFTFDALPHKLTFTFDQDVSASLTAADFFIRKTDGTGQITPTLEPYDSVNNGITLTLPGITPDGRYVVTLSSAGITNATGGQLDGDNDGAAGPDFDFNFFFLAGDANHDASVDFNDLVALAQHYNTPAFGPTLGDFNYDGDVDFNDLVTLAQRYNTSLPTAGLVASATSSPALATNTTTRDLLSTFSRKRVVVPKPKPAPLHHADHPAPVRKAPQSH